MTDSDQHREDDRERPTPARPRSVRDGAGPPRPRRASDQGKGRSEEKERPKPTPVRDMAAVEAPPPSVDPDVEHAELHVDEEDWVVRVLGRSGGTETSPTPLLLLGFWRAGKEDGAREREALVVGRSLAEQTPASLAHAFAESQPPPEPKPQTDDRRGGRGRRGRGSRRRGGGR